MPYKYTTLEQYNSVRKLRHRHLKAAVKVLAIEVKSLEQRAYYYSNIEELSDKQQFSAEEVYSRLPEARLELAAASEKLSERQQMDINNLPRRYAAQTIHGWKIFSATQRKRAVTLSLEYRESQALSS